MLPCSSPRLGPVGLVCLVGSSRHGVDPDSFIFSDNRFGTSQYLSQLSRAQPFLIGEARKRFRRCSGDGPCQNFLFCRTVRGCLHRVYQCVGRDSPSRTEHHYRSVALLRDGLRFVLRTFVGEPLVGKDSDCLCPLFRRLWSGVLGMGSSSQYISRCSLRVAQPLCS